MPNIHFSFRRGAGDVPEILYGKVEIKPTLAFARGTSLVLPAPTTLDLVNGEATANNVYPTPAPVAGQVEWAYRVKAIDTRGQSFEWMVGVPDSTGTVEFTALPRYFETKPPLFGKGEKGDPGEAAKITIGTTTSGTTPSVTNSGTNQNAILDFVLPQGPQGPRGDNSTYLALNTKNMSDAPNTYPNGLSSVRSSSTANGWPYEVTSITTSYAGYDGTALQIIKDAWGDSSRPPLIRWANVQTANTWTEFVPLVPGVATTTANGLMSSADKSKLEGITPVANSKTFSALPSTYSTGVTIVQVRVSDGWPLATTGTLVTHKTSTDSTSVGQWLYPVEGVEPLYRSSNASSLWTAFDTIATQSWVNGGKDYVTPEQFGAVGDGDADDSNALEEALNSTLSSGRELVLDSSKIYRISRTITNTAPTDNQNYSVGIRSSDSSRPATIYTTSNSTTPMIYIKGAEIGSTTLNANTTLQQRSWGVTSSSLLSKGKLMGVVSTLPWYYDPRPESTDARKSELHRVDEVSEGRITTEAPSNDGYITAYETTTIRAIQPISVSISNIRLTRPALEFSETASRYVGLRIDYSDNPLIERVVVENATATGIQVRNSYRGSVRDCTITGSNNYFEGYGVTISGCSFTEIEKTYISLGRRAADVSSGNNIVSHNVTIRNCTFAGGGKASNGAWFGWDPITNALSTRNGGFGSHSAAADTVVEGCTTFNCVEPYVVRGLNSTYRNNTHIGRTDVAVFGLAEGGGVTLIQDNNALSGWLGSDKYQFGENARRANAFIRTYSSYDLANGRIVVKGNYAEVTKVFALLGTISPASAQIPRYLNVTDNRVGFSDGTTEGGTLLFNPGGSLVPSGNRWIIGPNELRHDANAGTPKITSNINLAGNMVLDYNISGATT